MNLFDEKCDLCGKASDMLLSLGGVGLCPDCVGEIADEATSKVPEGCERRFLFYRWLRVTGRINEDLVA